MMRIPAYYFGSIRKNISWHGSVGVSGKPWLVMVLASSSMVCRRFFIVAIVIIGDLRSWDGGDFCGVWCESGVMVVNSQRDKKR